MKVGEKGNERTSKGTENGELREGQVKNEQNEERTKRDRKER